MNERTQRRLAAIVSADVVGYSRMMGIDETGTLVAMRAHRAQLIDPAINEHGGRIVKTMGDGLLLEFPSVVDAVRCSIAVQEGMAERNADVPGDKQIVLRIGINLGDIIIDGDDILGDGINIAARLESISEPGGICISRRVHEDVQDRLDATFVDGGEQTLKNITRPVRVWRWASDTKSEDSPATPSLALPEKPSIAVLAFDNMSDDPEQEFFADGIAEDIITALSRFYQFHVIARNSSFTYKGVAVDIGQVGRELSAQYVVEGSVRKSGNRIRVTAQMIEASSGRHVWADRYDGELEDIFDLQDNITNNIVGAIWPAMTQAELERASRKRPESFDVWELNLQALRAFNQAGPADLKLVREFAEKILSLDPCNADALGMIAVSHTTEGWMGYTPDPNASIAKGIEVARQTLQIDGSNTYALTSLGYALFGGRQFDEGLDFLSQSVGQNPNWSNSWFIYGMCLGFTGQFEEAIEAIERAMRLSPRDPMLGVMMSQQAIAAFIAGEYEIGAEYGRRAVQNAPSFPGAHRSRAANLAELGKIEEARLEVAEIAKLAPTISVASTRASMPFRSDEALERYCNALAKADLPLN